MSQDCIYIIDTFSLMFQVFHAIPPMTGTQGQPTNAVFGFTRDMFAILERKPTFLVCAFDSPGPGQRESIYPKYKANRTEMPEDLRPQIPLIKQLLEGFRIPILECPAWEADDVIATLTAQAVAKDIEVVIVSTDKDARQLLGPKVRMLNCRKNTFFDEAGLMEDWGVRPDQVVDFQSLVGDSVDNVPGVPNVGPKTARTLIEKFGTLENVLANADKAPGKKVAENLRTFADQARLSWDLVRLRQDLPISLELDAARVHEPDHKSLYDLFNLLGFRRHAAQMRECLSSLPENGTPGPAAASVFESHSEQPSSSQFVRDITSLSTALKHWEHAAEVFMEVETSGTGIRQQRLTAAALTAGESTILVDLSSAEKSKDDGLATRLLSWISLFSGRVVISSAKPLCHVLLVNEMTLPSKFFDASIADYLLDAGARTHDLAGIVDRHATESVKTAAISDTRKGRQKTMFDDEDSTAAEAQPGNIQESANRCERQLRLLVAVTRALESGLDGERLRDLYEHLEEPLIRVLARMEFAGISVDVEELRQQSVKVTEQID